MARWCGRKRKSRSPCPDRRAAIRVIGAVEWDTENDRPLIRDWCIDASKFEGDPIPLVETRDDGATYFVGWPLSDLAELSIALGEGTVCGDPIEGADRG